MIDADGVRIRPGSVLVPWAAVVDVSVLPVDRAPDLVELAVRHDFHDRWLAGQRWWVRAMWALERIWRPDAVRLILPGVRASEAEVLGALLRSEAKRQGRLKHGRSQR